MLPNKEVDMLNLHEIDLHNLDRRMLTPKMWELIKGEAVRRAQAERKELMRSIFRNLAFWRPKLAQPGGQRVWVRA